MKTIKDYKTGLEWLSTMSEQYMSWHSAKRYTKQKGFRLPTREELKTLGNGGQYPTVKHLKKKGFMDIKRWIWTNEEQSTTYAFYVSLDSGYSNLIDKTYNLYVACVRNMHTKYAMEGNDGD